MVARRSEVLHGSITQSKDDHLVIAEGKGKALGLMGLTNWLEMQQRRRRAKVAPMATVALDLGRTRLNSKGKWRGKWRVRGDVPSKAWSEEGEVGASPTEPSYRPVMLVRPARYFLTARSAIARARVLIG